MFAYGNHFPTDEDFVCFMFFMWCTTEHIQDLQISPLCGRISFYLQYSSCNLQYFHEEL